MPSPYPTITPVTASVSQVKAADLVQMIPAIGNGPQGLLMAPAVLLANSGSTAFSGATWAGAQTTGLTLTYNFPAGRRIRVGWDGFVGSSVGTDSIFVLFGKDGVISCLSIAFAANECGIVFEDTPSAGSHTYEVRVSRDVGTGNVYMYGGNLQSGLQAQLYIEDMGIV